MSTRFPTTARSIAICVPLCHAVACKDDPQAIIGPHVEASGVLEVDTVMDTGGADPATDSASLCAEPPEGWAGRVGVAPEISGACSTDPEGDTIRYEWSVLELPTGSLAEIHDRHLPAPTLIPDVPGLYVVQLVVRAGDRTSPPATIELTVGTCGIVAPVAETTVVGASPGVGSIVGLTATVVDTDTAAKCAAHDASFSYAWTLLGAPDGSSSAIEGASGAKPWFSPDVAGTYVVRLVVTDPTGRASDPVDTSIEVTTCGEGIPVASGTANVSSTSVGTGVQLVGTATDPDTDDACGLSESFSYAWNLVAVPAGSAASLNSPDAATVAFIPDVAGDYVAELIVTDASGHTSAPSRVEISADACGANTPVAAARKLGPGGTVACTESPIAVNLGGNNDVQLDGSISTDPDNDVACGLTQTLTYQWTLLSTPLDTGSSKIRYLDAETTVLDARSDGRYIVRLVVTDPSGRQSTETRCILDVSNSG